MPYQAFMKIQQRFEERSLWRGDEVQYVSV